MESNKQPLNVVFGSRQSLRTPLPKNSLLIVPSADDWNDFGYRTRVDIHVRLANDNAAFETSGFIGFFGDTPRVSRGADQLAEMVKDLGQLTIPASDQHRFFTMLPSMDAYRQLVSALKVEGAEIALLGANDLVALNEFKASANWLDSAVQTRIFSMSFIRESEAYFAYNNAGPLLRGLEMEPIGRISSEFSIKFQLAGLNNPHEMRFAFEHDADLPKRVAIVIGKNGVGKSQTLGRIALAAITGSKDLSDGTPNGRPLMSRLLAFAPTNEAESVFPSERRKRSRTWYRRFTLNRARKSKRNEYLCELIIQVARSSETIKESSRWKIFTDAIRALHAPHQLSLPTKTSDRHFEPLFDLKATNEQRQLERYASIDPRREPVRVIEGNDYPLSSGEISFVKFAAQASLNIENGSLLLLDEPETHLHPNFISQFMGLLNGLLSQTGSAAIIATHSAFFVREVFREQVTVLRIDETGSVHGDHPRLRTFGADVGAISYFVFGEEEPSQLASEVTRRLMEKNLSWEAIHEQYKNEFSREFMTSIRASIEDGKIQ